MSKEAQRIAELILKKISELANQDEKDRISKEVVERQEQRAAFVAAEVEQLLTDHRTGTYYCRAIGALNGDVPVGLNEAGQAILRHLNDRLPADD